MLYWIIQSIILSFIFIVLVHNLIILLKDNLTVPKVKDLVKSNKQKYENIYNAINSSQNVSQNANVNNMNDEYLPKKEETETAMKSELKNFLKRQLGNDTQGTDISTLDSLTPLETLDTLGSLQPLETLESSQSISYSDF
jgi:hypothetical protein